MRKAMGDIEKGYIAATVDCEGTLGAGEHCNRGNWTIRAYLVVGNTNVNLLNWLYYTSGIGSIGNGNNHPKEGHKPSFVWRVTGGRQLQWLLKIIYPYLIIKKKQAELLLELTEMKSLSNRGGKFYPERQYEILDRVRELNVRGVKNNANERIIK